MKISAQPSTWRVPSARLSQAAQSPRLSSVDAFAWKWTLGLLALGLAWRILRYALRFPIWGDEAFVCVNFLNRNYLGLLKPLDYKQVAPLLFLWSELAVFRLLGGSEWAVRLLPFLAGIGSLFLFWRFARLTANSIAALLAVGILAVSYYPIRHACEVKPYAFDLFWSLVLLTLAAQFLSGHKPRLCLAILAAVVPLALGASYPAVFVAGGVSLALLPTVWRIGKWQDWTLFGIYNLATAASFLVCYRLSGMQQFDSTGGTHNGYWSEWFPPSGPFALLKWLVTVHTGNLLAYPAGGSGGASAFTFLLCLIGAWIFGRTRQWSTLALCLIPFGLTFIAAALHRYPYGGSARVAQHLAPAICLLAGSGAATIICWLARSEIARRRCFSSACICLALIAAMGIGRDWRKPYKTPADATLRGIVDSIARQAKSSDQIVVMDAPEEVAAPFVWYLRQLKNPKDGVHWNGQIDWDRVNQVESPPGDLWCLYLTRDFSRRDAIAKTLAPARQSLVLAGHEEYSLQFGQSIETLEHCEVFHWMSVPGYRPRSISDKLPNAESDECR